MESYKPLPDKIFYKIGEVSKYLSIEPYVIRYWESEFKFSPARNKGKQRRYRKEDIEFLLKIKQLLYDNHYTILGAKEVLNKEKETSSKKIISEIKKKLQEILKTLS